jgi:hypothetical protein
VISPALGGSSGKRMGGGSIRVDMCKMPTDECAGDRQPDAIPCTHAHYLDVLSWLRKCILELRIVQLLLNAQDQAFQLTEGANPVPQNVSLASGTL